ncbi:MAG: ABC transporter substrate-binding protein [Kaiparowitsia implicata GSE-PSE-MK54-09C]|jgi:multiple sugar transport system substrate-binding protein|nr:ABC transporter substrate-binding protein [Kaiparowitsia implicata GSE-PSE-MK54-09C]
MALVLGGLLVGCQPGARQTDGITHLTLWQGVNPPPNRDVLDTLVRQFNATHSTIQVESLYVGQSDQQMPKILAAIVGNAPPDLLWYAPMITGQLVELEALRSLDDWLETTAGRDQIDPALLESMQWEGHTWSIPFGTNNVAIFYRPSLFEAAGIDTLPQTWDELRQTAQTLTIPSRNQHGMLLPLGKGEWTVFTWLPFMWSGGGELVAEPGDAASDAAPPVVQIDNEGAIAALHLWQDLMTDGSVVLSQPERGYELDGFLAGRVAMQLTGPWTLGQLAATDVDYGVMPIPTGARRATVVGGENLFVFRSTPEREQAALTFAEYVLSAEFQTQWAIGTGYLPVNLRSRDRPDYQTFVAQQPAVEVFVEQAPYGRSRPIFPGYNRISDNLGRAIEAVLLGKATPEGALAESQQRLDLALGGDRPTASQRP